MTDRVRRRELPAALALIVLAAIVGLAAIFRRPDITRTENFLFADQSLNLLVAERLLGGGLLYADIFTPYGPIPAYLHAAVAGVFGNTILVYNLLLLALSLTGVALVWFLVRRYLPPPTALALVLVAVVPSFLLPGGAVGAITASPYVPIERALVIATALLWLPPAIRSTRRSAAIGALFAAWQWVKFGGAFFAGATILLVDAIAVVYHRDRNGLPRRWLRLLLVTLAVFIAGELLRVGVALAFLPTEIARDFIWPSYHLETYRAWITPDQRWLTLNDWRTVVGQYLAPLAGLLAAVAVTLWIVAREGRRRRAAGADFDDLRLLLPALFFIVGSAAYLPSAHQLRQFLWAPAIALAFILIRLPALPRIGVLALGLPSFLLTARINLMTPADPARQPVRVPSGDVVWMTESLDRDVNAVVGELRAIAPGSGAAAGDATHPVIVPMGAGLHVLYQLPTPVRQPWIIPGFHRPYDERALLDALPSTTAIVLHHDNAAELGDRSVCAWFPVSPFSQAFCDDVDPRLGAPTDTSGTFAVRPL